MRDPLEGVTADGLIVTGARRDRIDDRWWPVLDAVCRAVGEAAPDAAVYVYGSVATGQAVVGRSDVDLLTVGLRADVAAGISVDLSHRFGDACRGVEIGAATDADLAGDGDEAYGNRVFLRHYCVHLAGPDEHTPTSDFPADRRAARGFNGDIGRHLVRWRSALDDGHDVAVLTRRVARKTLLAVAGLVSVHDRTWTTDRVTAAHRWSEIDVERADGVMWLLDHAEDTTDTTDTTGTGPATLRELLDGTVVPIVARFERDIGLWASVTPAS